MKKFDVIWYSAFSLFAVGTVIKISIIDAAQRIEALGPVGHSVHLVIGTLGSCYFVRELFKAVKSLKGKE